MTAAEPARDDAPSERGLWGRGLVMAFLFPPLLLLALPILLTGKIGRGDQQREASPALRLGVLFGCLYAGATLYAAYNAFYSTEQPTHVSVTKFGNGDIKVTGREDRVVVTGATVNRGNCVNHLSTGTFPVVLKFGETVTLSADCNPIEVEITTEAGADTFTWKQ